MAQHTAPGWQFAGLLTAESVQRADVGLDCEGGGVGQDGEDQPLDHLVGWTLQKPLILLSESLRDGHVDFPHC